MAGLEQPRRQHQPVGAGTRDCPLSLGAPGAGVVTNAVSDARRRREPADQACIREAASARAARPLRAASASAVILAALLATVGLASALPPLTGLADHDGDESALRSCSRLP